jgi:ATP-dependent DNA helicase DinG
MPLPDEDAYLDSLVEHIRTCIELTHGKAFVLFTSYQNLRYCAERLTDFCRKKGIRILVQGDGMNRSRMLDQFRADVDSVIFGTTSFWTGVDVPGEALSNVIITKLPFSVPSHPLIEGRIEKIKESGENPFMAYNLPEAILKFKQGCGRLIRNRTDSGIIAILDRRLVAKRYGNYFLESIPDCPREYL